MNLLSFFAPRRQMRRQIHILLRGHHLSRVQSSDHVHRDLADEMLDFSWTYCWVTPYSLWTI